MARSNLSMVISSGRKIGSMTEDMNNTVISGTPRQNSIKTTDADLAIGIEERLPRARIMPMGRAQNMPMVARIRVSIRPPHLWVSTTGRPNAPP